MKTTLVALLLLIGALTSPAQTVITNTGCVEFSWGIDAPASDIHAFYLFHTTNYTAPIWPAFNGWQVIGGTTNGASTNLSINVSVGPHFFFMCASNSWGLAPASNVVGTSNAPPQVINFKITSQTMLPCP